MAEASPCGQQVDVGVGSDVGQGPIPSVGRGHSQDRTEAH